MPNFVTGKSRVLFLCVGNSCRSQMAEAIVNAHLGEQWKAFSAGSRPAGHVHPMVTQVLSEIGINHQGRPKPIHEFIGQSFNVVITLCDDSADACPVWLGKGRQLHYPFPDPTVITGSDEQILQAFRQVRDEIAQKILPLLVDYSHQRIA